MKSVENMLESRTLVEVSALLVQHPWPLQLYFSALLAQTPCPITPALDATDHWRIGADKQGCNNFTNVTFVLKEDKIIWSYKCGLEPVNKITDLVENIAI